jgi:diaphanous 1
MLTVSLIEMSSSVTALQTAMKATREALNTMPAGPSDEMIAILEPFILTAQPKISKLARLHMDVQTDLASLATYLGCGKDEIRPEEILSIVVSFSSILQKAASEMAKHPLEVKPSLPPPLSSLQLDGSGVLLLAAARRETQASSGSAETIKLKFDEEGMIRSVGTMNRGDLDQAIRSIHGGVRRRERREASTIGRGVRLSKIFLDGGGCVKANTSKVE